MVTQCLLTGGHRNLYIICINPLKPSGHYMYRTVVTIYTASLTFTILRSAHTVVFICFVWISEQTAIIPLYNINWLLFVTETQNFTARYGLSVAIFSSLIFIFYGWIKPQLNKIKWQITVYN